MKHVATDGTIHCLETCPDATWELNGICLDCQPGCETCDTNETAPFTYEKFPDSTNPITVEDAYKCLECAYSDERLRVLPGVEYLSAPMTTSHVRCIA